MVGGVSGIGSYMGYYRYPVSTGRTLRSAGPAQSSQAAQTAGSAQEAQAGQTAQTETNQAAGRVGIVGGTVRGANPDVPVEAVRPVSVVHADAAKGTGYAIPFLRRGMDPAELAVRMRIQYQEGVQKDAALENPSGEEKASGIEGVQEALEEGKCETCEKRKYQDGSNDAGVSYKTPTKIAPEQAAAAVRGHEMEHVVREQAKAEREDRAVVSQSVTIHTDICPECGKVYVSGGTTKTTTAGRQGQGTAEAGQEAIQPHTPFSAVA